MAIIQYSTEASSNQRPDQKYNIAKIIEFIAGIDQEIDNKLNLPQVCKRIIELLGYVDIPGGADSVSAFQESIKKVDAFLVKLIDTYPNQDVMSACLNQLYQLIMTTDNPSPSAGIILHRIDMQTIPNATQWFLSKKNCSDDDIKRGVQTLVRWIAYPHIVKNLHFWIIGILKALREQQKYELLVEIAEKNMFQLQKLSSVPTLHKDVITIIIHILISARHSSDLFLGFLKNYTEIYRKNLSNVDLRQLDDTLVALMLHFPARTQTVQKEYNRVRDLIQPSIDYHGDILDVPPWHDQFKYNQCRNTNARVGLVNLGNTCYMNSVLQALMMTKQFTRDLLLTEIATPLFLEMRHLMALLLHSNRPQLSPNYVHQAARPPGFHPGHEQDSSEFLGHLLDQLHEQEKPKCDPPQVPQAHTGQKPSTATDEPCPMEVDEEVIISDPGSDGACALITTDSGAYVSASDASAKRLVAPRTLIQKSFGGSISITYKCLNCQTESKQYDSFRDLHLSFPDGDENNANHSVQELLDFYCSTEKLDAENKYFCGQCKALCVGERFINIISAPCNLILTLKHFKYDQKYNMRAKLMHKVRHEDVISVKVFPGSGYKDDVTLHYRLYAAVVHSGVSMETGHYFTYGSDATGCYKFDDSYVSKSSLAELHNLQPPQTPYILFYQMVPNPDGSSAQATTAPTMVGSSNTTALAAAADQGAATTYTMCEYPALEDLPPQLREYVNSDNITYSEEGRSSRSVPGASVWAQNRKNNFYKPDDDNNDEPPSGPCGGNFAPSYNRYTF